MADLPSSAPVSSVGSQSGGGGGVSGGGGGNYQSAPATVINLPDNLQSISQNVTLGARLVGTNMDGSVVLSTAQGNVTLQSPFALQTNTPVQIQFQPGNPPTAILILAAPGGGATQNNNVGQAVINDISEFEFNTLSQLLSSVGPTGSATLQQGSNIAAVVIGRPDANPALAQNGGAALQASGLADVLEELASNPATSNNSGASEQIKLMSQFGVSGPLPGEVGQLSLSGKLLTTLQQTMQQLESQPTGNFPTGDSAAALKVLLQLGQGGAGAASADSPGGQPLQPGILANLTAAGGTGLPPGTPLTLKIIDIIPPGQTVPPAGGTQTGTPAAALPGSIPAPAAPGQQAPIILTGQLSSQTLNNLPLLQTPQGTLVLQAASKLPPGTTLVLELSPAAQQAGATGQAALDVSKANPAAPKLEQMLQMLAETDNQTFQLLMNSMPRLNGNFPPTALFFLQALRSGDIQNWLGDKGMQALRRIGPQGTQLLGELEEEFRTIAGRADSAKPGEWRVMTVPYLGEYGIANMQLGVRNHFQAIDPDERRKFNLDDNAGRVTRFIFDVQFSELGPMQIDGLLRPRIDYQKQLDVLVRTQQMLPAEMRQDLRDVFTESMGAYGMSGVLSFQAGYQNWISLSGRQSGQAQTRV